MRKKSLNLRKKHITEAYIFISPFILGVIVFLAFPLYISVKLSFGKLINMSGFKIAWQGFDNYVRAFVLDPYFIPMFLEAILQVLRTAPLVIVFSLILAIFVNKNIKGKGFFRTVYFLPFLLGTGYVMEQLLGQNVNAKVMTSTQMLFISPEILEYLGPAVSKAINDFFGNIVTVLWSSGVQFLLFLSGLQGIPQSLYESAKIDSATEWEMFWNITLPMIMPIMLLNIVYTLVDIFIDIKNPLLDYIHILAFQRAQFDYAAAIGWLYFVFILLLVLIVFKVLKRQIINTGVEGELK